jgi:hypothetical protein
MQQIPVNVIALVVVAVAKSFIGFLWYSPVLFGKLFVRLAGCDEKKLMKDFPRAILIDIIANFIMAFVLVHAVVYAGANAFSTGLVVGIFNWIGFVAVGMLFSVNFEQRPFRLFLLNNGFQLITIALMGAVLAVWK